MNNTQSKFKHTLPREIKKLIFLGTVDVRIIVQTENTQNVLSCADVPIIIYRYTKRTQQRQVYS